VQVSNVIALGDGDPIAYKVGINTANPASTLDVNGDMRVSGSVISTPIYVSDLSDYWDVNGVVHRYVVFNGGLGQNENTIPAGVDGQELTIINGQSSVSGINIVFVDETGNIRLGNLDSSTVLFSGSSGGSFITFIYLENVDGGVWWEINRSSF